MFTLTVFATRKILQTLVKVKKQSTTLGAV